jgi:sugar-specific transcriptional regulator TrmB
MDTLLTDIGLSDYEAKVYSTLLSHSPASAASIAKSCALSRSTVYTALNSLSGKGLVGTSYKNEVKQFVAQDPEALNDLLEREKTKVVVKEAALKKLKGLLQNNEPLLGIPKIVIFEGKEGLQKIYKAMLWNAPKNSVMRIMRDEFVWNKDWSFVFEEKWHSSVKKTRIEKNIKTRLLVNDSPVEKKKSEFYKSRKGLEWRFSSEKFNNFAVYSIHDEVSVLSFEKNNLVGIRITNQNISENFKRIFDGLWKKA